MWNPFPISNYPPGVGDNTPGAPWNDNDSPELIHEVTISCTFSTTLTTSCKGVEPDYGELYNEIKEKVKDSFKDAEIDEFEIVEDNYTDPNEKPDYDD